MVSTHPKNISQIGNLPQIGVKIKKNIFGTYYYFCWIGLGFNTNRLHLQPLQEVLQISNSKNPGKKNNETWCAGPRIFQGSKKIEELGKVYDCMEAAQKSTQTDCIICSFFNQGYYPLKQS